MACAERGRVPLRVEENDCGGGDLNNAKCNEYRFPCRDGMRRDQQCGQQPRPEGGSADPCRAVLTHEVQNLWEVRRCGEGHADERRDLSYRNHVSSIPLVSHEEDREPGRFNHYRGTQREQGQPG